MNIFVARLNYDTRERDLRHAFEEFGDVDNVKIVMDHYTGQSRGFGFVEMPNDQDARSAISELNNEYLDGRKLVVKKAEPRNSHSRSKGYSGGYDSRPSYGNTYGRNGY
ncbi:MAG: RNA-binding protein [Saprospiraceae bacterium]|nr:RNA-binding protein [Lewinella sp.]